MASPVVPGAKGANSQRVRALAVIVVVVCLFATLVGRLWYLQVADANVPAAQQAVSQGLETIYIPAPRGDIFSRDGALLAGNHIEQVVEVQPDAVTEHPAIVGELAAVLDEPVKTIRAAIDNPQYSPYQPVPVAEGVSTSVALSISEHQQLLPGVTVAAQPVRYYPYGSLTANIVGYVTQITGKEYSANKDQMCAKGIPCYTPTSQVGQAGVEASLEQYLRGVPGKEVLDVNAQGQVLGVASYTPPVPGDNIVLSISLADQKAAMTALEDWTRNARTMVGFTSFHDYRAPAAAMVVEDPRNGQLLALATYPDYNDNNFVGGISYKKWAYYNNPANNYPLEDRPVSWAGATGSTFKLITATADLDYGIRGPYQLYHDVGGITVGGQFFRDNAGIAAGYVDLQQAITISDDAYFYSLGYDMWKLWAGSKGHPEYLQKIASEYGLGHYSGVQLPGEAPGLVPSQQVFTKQHDQYPKAYPNSYFDPGQEIQEAIGQGEDEVTPLQLADAYSAFANGGTLYVPKIALAVEEPGTGGKPNGKIVKLYAPQVKDHVQMPSAQDRAVMISGFEGVTANPQGTAYGAFTRFPLSRIPVAGKTGTAQVGPNYSQVGWPKYVQNTSVFSSFAPADNPRFVVDAFFAQAGYGACAAAPAVVQEYYTLFGLAKQGSLPASVTSTLPPGC
ncbi:MAG: penicillin-binding transpeptidase domain-containing protein [Actinobacteria bacterium]|nr:penicillin-binding transpeptidase domain-containing protein [Actinomycetota bacterium]